MTDIDNVIWSARQWICATDSPWTGPDIAADHGHTDCWIIGGLLTEVARLRKRIAELEAPA